MNWLSDLYQEYQFQLWVVKCTSYEQLEEIIYNDHPSKQKVELIIASHPKYACWYANDIIKGQWPLGEKAIAINPPYAYLYALYIIKGPWSPGEKAIASHSGYAYWYVRNIINGPWPPGEKAIASDPYWKKRYESFFKVKL